MTSSVTPIQSSAVVTITSALIFLRILVGCHHHSGENNYLGKVDGYGGDYEAQRHWMEITFHLPIGQWYTYDLAYWGLDYPPLTAYFSYVCGFLSHVLVRPETVALFTSRAYEDATHKAFMRASVLVLDAMIYFSAVWVIAKRLEPKDSKERIWIFGLALAQPSMILVDHGHFQYNSVSLGLAMWSFHFMTLTDSDTIQPFTNCVIGSILFCLSLNFKQMALYYAPAVFAYLLGRSSAGSASIIHRKFLVRFFTLGITVILSFLALWLPFVLYRSEGDTPFGSILHIIERVFPFKRGLYEGKVSNIWCALSTKPFSFRDRVPERLQPMCALVLTISLCLPPCVALFKIGKECIESKKASGHKYDSQLRALLWGASSTSISFFLASFQVHEKSILMTLSPLSVLVAETPLLCFWFSVASAWTLWPLVEMDRIQTAYFACVVIYCLICLLYDRPFATLKKYSRGGTALVRDGISNSVWPFIIVVLSFIGMIGLHIVESTFDAPEKLPDLFPVLWSIGGAGMFCIFWGCSYWQLKSQLLNAITSYKKLKSQ